MEIKKKHNFIYSMIVMIVVLILSYAFDFLYYFLSNRAQATFTFMPIIFLALVFPFGIALLITFITWFTIGRTRPETSTQLIYLIVGLLFQIFLVSSLRVFPIWLRGTFIDKFRQIVFSHGLISFYSIATASLVILGVIGLLRKPKNKAVENQAS